MNLQELVVESKALIPLMYESHERFKDKFIEGTRLSIPLSCTNVNADDLYILYTRTTICLVAEDYNQRVSDILELYIKDTDDVCISSNDYDPRFDRFRLGGVDFSLIINIDQYQHNNSFTRFTSLDMVNDTCYINGTDYDGIKETLFQMALTEKIREPEEIMEEANLVWETVKILPPSTEFSADMSLIDESMWDFVLSKMRELML